MTEREFIKDILVREELKAKRSLGQNFLLDEAVLDLLLENLGGERHALELAAGLGSLSTRLLQHFNALTVVEIDSRFWEILEGRLASVKEAALDAGEEKNFELITGDLLKVDYSDFNNTDLVVYANLPYYITQKSMEKLICELPAVREFRFVLQLEAIQRLLAKAGSSEYGPINVMIALCYDAELVRQIHAQAFYPVPKVRSGYFRIISKGIREFNSVELRKSVLHFLKILFNNRRKQIGKIIKQEGIKLRADSIQKFLNKRAEELSPDELLEIYHASS